MADCLGESLPARWWTDPEILRAEYVAHGTLQGAGAAHPPSARTLGLWWMKLGLPVIQKGPRAEQVSAASPGSGDGWLLDALKKLGDTATVEDLADHADVPPKRVRDALDRLGHDGYRVAEHEHHVVLNRVPPPSNNVHRTLFAGEDISFGVLGDTHLSSNHECIEELHMAYRIMEDEGITTCYHVGDLVAGVGVFPGQVNEIKNHTYESQVQYAVDNYPRSSTVHTHMISGNHDLLGHFGKIGANPVVAFCNQRDDVSFAGDYCATFELEQGTRIYLLHPAGGIGYAADYKLRKIAEGFEAGAKPHVLFCGHWHRRAWFEARAIQMVMTGCFESGGTFGARLGLSDPAVGFHIVRMRVADDGSVVRFLPEWWKFHPGRTVT